MCKGTSHWAASSSASRPHSDLPISFPKGTCTALSEETVNYSGTFIFLLFSSNAMLQWPLHNGQCLLVFVFFFKKNPFQAFDFAIELNGWISSTQGNTWQCLMISIFNSRRNVPQSSRGSRVGALDCGRPAWRQERRIWKSTGGADGPARRRDC